LKCAISQKRSRRNGDEKRGDIEHANDGDGNDDDGDEEEYPIVLRANYNTMKSEISEIKCAYRINFTKLDNIGSLLGFSYIAYIATAYIATAKMVSNGHAD